MLEVSEAITHEGVATHIYISRDNQTLLESTAELPNPGTWAISIDKGSTAEKHLPDTFVPEHPAAIPSNDKDLTAEKHLPGTFVPEHPPATSQTPATHDT